MPRARALPASLSQLGGSGPGAGSARRRWVRAPFPPPRPRRPVSVPSAREAAPWPLSVHRCRSGPGAAGSVRAVCPFQRGHRLLAPPSGAPTGSRIFPSSPSPGNARKGEFKRQSLPRPGARFMGSLSRDGRKVLYDGRYTEAQKVWERRIVGILRATHDLLNGGPDASPLFPASGSTRDVPLHRSRARGRDLPAGHGGPCWTDSAPSSWAPCARRPPARAAPPGSAPERAHSAYPARGAGGMPDRARLSGRTRSVAAARARSGGASPFRRLLAHSM